MRRARMCPCGCPRRIDVRRRIHQCSARGRETVGHSRNALRRGLDDLLGTQALGSRSRDTSANNACRHLVSKDRHFSADRSSRRHGTPRFVPFVRRKARDTRATGRPIGPSDRSRSCLFARAHGVMTTRRSPASTRPETGTTTRATTPLTGLMTLASIFIASMVPTA